MYYAKNKWMSSIYSQFVVSKLGYFLAALTHNLLQGRRHVTLTETQRQQMDDSAFTEVPNISDL